MDALQNAPSAALSEPYHCQSRPLRPSSTQRRADLAVRPTLPPRHSRILDYSDADRSQQGCRPPSARDHRAPSKVKGVHELRFDVTVSSSCCLQATGGVRRGRNADPRSAHNAPEPRIAGRLFLRASVTPHIQLECGRRTAHQRWLKGQGGSERVRGGVRPAWS